MSYNTHFRCDQCEDILHVEDEGEAYEEGWLVLSFGEDEGASHFCSLSCVSRWADSDQAREAVAASMNQKED